MEFKELIEARRSVRKYVASEISKAEVEAIVGAAVLAQRREGAREGGRVAARTRRAVGRLRSVCGGRFRG